MNRRNFIRSLTIAALGLRYVRLPAPNPCYTITLTSTPVTATVRKLKTTWSEEADQNLSNMYGVKADLVLLSVISQLRSV
jgi:hypothetical protein